ncbi:hypothetical protein [Nocardia sp. NPDC057353]|uniref:hypothetical protein n=1 Tax=Nocardia sp. NPDC057353 TaxID=3346104 RepID=UPI003645F1E3
MDIPPDVLEQIKPLDPGFQWQPVATVAAACIALIAAIVAWRGIQAQVTASATNLQLQLKAQRDLSHRSDVLNIVKEFSASLAEMSSLLLKVRNRRRRWIKPPSLYRSKDAAELERIIISIMGTWGYFSVIGPIMLRSEFTRYIGIVTEYVKSGGGMHEESNKKFFEALDATADLIVALHIYIDSPDHFEQVWQKKLDLRESEEAK